MEGREFSWWTSVYWTLVTMSTLGFGDIVFTSDLGDGPDVQAQVWSVNSSGQDLRQHTFHTADDGYVRDAASDGTGVVYHARGRLFHLAGLKAEPQPIELTTAVGRPRPTLRPNE